MQSRTMIVTAVLASCAIALAACSSPNRMAASAESATPGFSAEVSPSMSASALNSAGASMPESPASAVSSATPISSAMPTSSVSPASSAPPPADAAEPPPVPRSQWVLRGNVMTLSLRPGPNSGPLSRYEVTVSPRDTFPDKGRFIESCPVGLTQVTECTLALLPEGPSDVWVRAVSAGTETASFWYAGASADIPMSAYPVNLDAGQRCGPNAKSKVGGMIRNPDVTIVNWLPVDLYIEDRGENFSLRTLAKGRIPSGNTGYRCSTGASATIGSPLYMLLDVGFGEDPILRNGPDGPVYQSIDASNPWMGKPSFSMRVLDGAGKLNALSANMAVGDGQALAWGKRYYVVTRKEDDSCGSDRICFELRMSRLPAGVTSGDRFDWSPGSGNQAPAPVPLD